MYNSDLPRRADLPTSAQLRRSTWIAGVAASAILVFVVLPSEYAIDPTGVGSVLGLTHCCPVQLWRNAKLIWFGFGVGGFGGVVSLSIGLRCMRLRRTSRANVSGLATAFCAAWAARRTR